jgi:hypothetical protein
VQNNVMSLFGLNRRLRAASLGFLAAFEATSSAPSRKIARGLQRLDFPPEIVEYYTEHVEADAVHEQLAVRTVCGTLIEEEPEQHANVWFGAAAAPRASNPGATAPTRRCGSGPVAERPAAQTLCQMSSPRRSASNPPSTKRTCPVMRAFAGETRKACTAAMCSASATPL